MFKLLSETSVLSTMSYCHLNIYLLVAWSMDWCSTISNTHFNSPSVDYISIYSTNIQWQDGPQKKICSSRMKERLLWSMYDYLYVYKAHVLKTWSSGVRCNPEEVTGLQEPLSNGLTYWWFLIQASWGSGAWLAEACQREVYIWSLYLALATLHFSAFWPLQHEHCCSTTSSCCMILWFTMKPTAVKQVDHGLMLLKLWVKMITFSLNLFYWVWFSGTKKADYLCDSVLWQTFPGKTI